MLSSDVQNESGKLADNRVICFANPVCDGAAGWLGGRMPGQEHAHKDSKIS